MTGAKQHQPPPSDVMISNLRTHKQPNTNWILNKCFIDKLNLIRVQRQAGTGISKNQRAGISNGFFPPQDSQKQRWYLNWWLDQIPPRCLAKLRRRVRETPEYKYCHQSSLMCCRCELLPAGRGGGTNSSNFKSFH